MTAGFRGCSQSTGPRYMPSATSVEEEIGEVGFANYAYFLKVLVRTELTERGAPYRNETRRAEFRLCFGCMASPLKGSLRPIQSQCSAQWITCYYEIEMLKAPAHQRSRLMIDGCMLAHQQICHQPSDPYHTNSSLMSTLSPKLSIPV